jgi:hypothetical protein
MSLQIWSYNFRTTLSKFRLKHQKYPDVYTSPSVPVKDIHISTS